VSDRRRNRGSGGQIGWCDGGYFPGAGREAEERCRDAAAHGGAVEVRDRKKRVLLVVASVRERADLRLNAPHGGPAHPPIRSLASSFSVRTGSLRSVFLMFRFKKCSDLKNVQT
jgi:hypothetical protein